MTSFDNALKSDEGNSVYPPDLAKAIFELDIPDRIYLKTAMEFDDKYIVNKEINGLSIIQAVGDILFSIKIISQIN